MTSLAVAFSLQYYARHGAALFPIPYGQKNPTGIVASFKKDWSKDPAQWDRWYAEHKCNFGLVAFASRMLVVDIDVTTAGRDAAWAAWCELCASWGLSEPLQPHAQSARGGWHVYLSLPDDVDAETLRQPDAIRKLINVRAIGFVVAAGSYYDGTAKSEESGAYVLLNEEPPHPAPAALIQHCTRAPAAERTNAPAIGSRDPGEIAALVKWLAERDVFTDYESWVSLGMALRVELGDAGFEVWAISHDDTVTDDVAESKWQSFATEPTPDSVTLATFIARANQRGWKGTIRKTASAMFEGVAAIAHQVGATLSSAKNAALMGSTDKSITTLGQPILDSFLAGTIDAPTTPSQPDAYPKLPEETQDRPLYELLSTAMNRIAAMAENPKTFRQGRVLPALGVLNAFHPTTCDQFCQVINAKHGIINPSALNAAIRRFENEVKSDTRIAAGFILNHKGEPAPENSDNTYVLFRLLAITFRTNTWKDRIEFSDDDGKTWKPLDDVALNGFLHVAENSEINYHPSKERLYRGAEYLADQSHYDPLRERVDALADAWDRVPRLDSWIAQTCGTPNDDYHCTVGRNLIGGMVRRARYAGCEHAETVIFISQKQGTGKSTLCKILALDQAWHTDSLKFGGSQQNTIPQMAGKWVIELSELAGMNKSAVEEIKNFMSATVDNYTKKYEAFAKDHPRRCVFIGTSNDKRPLLDVTGNRRFLPVHVVGEVNTDWLRANVEQIIGECAHREAQGESFSIPPEIWALTEQHQEAARAMTPVEEFCYEWFDRPPGAGYFITASDLNRALKMAGQHGRYSTFLDKLGWRNESLVVPADGRKCRVWVKHENNALAECTRLEPYQSVPNARVEMRMTRRTAPLSPPPY